MSKIEKLVVGFCLLFLVAFIGCAGVQNAITPTYIPEETIIYSGAEVPRWPSLYTNINDAEYVLKRIEYVRSLNDIEYAFIKDDLQTHLTNAKQLRDTVFDSSGPIGMLLPALSGLGLGSLLISKPGDKKEIEKLKNGKENA